MKFDGEKSLVGRLDKRVTIKRPRRSNDPPPNVDGYGQPIDNPITVATVWAAIEPLRGRDYNAAFAENAEVTTRIRIRYREDIDRTMTLERGAKVFEILYIPEPDLAKRELHLMCKERQ